MTATVNDREDIVKLLLENEAKPISESLSSNTALLKTCTRGQSDIVRLLLEAEANPNAYDERVDDNPLKTAIENDHLEVVSLLLLKAETQTILDDLRAVKENNATAMIELYFKFVPDSALYYAADMRRQDLITDLCTCISPIYFQ